MNWHALCLFSSRSSIQLLFCFTSFVITVEWYQFRLLFWSFGRLQREPWRFEPDMFSNLIQLASKPVGTSRSPLEQAEMLARVPPRRRRCRARVPRQGGPSRTTRRRCSRLTTHCALVAELSYCCGALILSACCEALILCSCYEVLVLYSCCKALIFYSFCEVLVSFFIRTRASGAEVRG